VGRRRAVQPATRILVLHECGYRCSNPTCRMVLTLDVHHIEYVSEGGGDSQENLSVLCPNCHALHHKGHIPRESLRAWKLLLLALNEAFDRRSVDILLALAKFGGVMIWGDGLLACASLVASGFVEVDQMTEIVETGGGFWSPATVTKEERVAKYWMVLSAKGRAFVSAWKKGDQKTAVGALGSPRGA